MKPTHAQTSSLDSSQFLCSMMEYGAPWLQDHPSSGIIKKSIILIRLVSLCPQGPTIQSSWAWLMKLVKSILNTILCTGHNYHGLQLKAANHAVATQTSPPSRLLLGRPIYITFTSTMAQLFKTKCALCSLQRVPLASNSLDFLLLQTEVTIQRGSLI